MSQKKLKRGQRPKITKPAKLKNDGVPRGKLWAALYDRIVELGLTRAQAALIVRDAASQLSRLMTGHVHEFSADRLALMLLGLSCDIEIIVSPRYFGSHAFRMSRSGPIFDKADLQKHLQSTSNPLTRGRIRVMRRLRNGQLHELHAR